MENHKQKILPESYSVIPRTLIFIKKNDKLLLLKGAVDKKIWPGLYNGIGGHVERGEDVLTAAKRELLEETGLRDINIDLRAIIFIDVEEMHGISMFVFSGNTNGNRIISNEEGTLEWIKISDLRNYPLVEDLYHLIPLVLKSDKKIKFGRYYYKDGKLLMAFE